MKNYIAEFVNTTADQLASSCELVARKSSPEAVDEFKNAISDAIDTLLVKLDYKKKLEEKKLEEERMFSDSIRLGLRPRSPDHWDKYLKYADSAL